MANASPFYPAVRARTLATLTPAARAAIDRLLAAAVINESYARAINDGRLPSYHEGEADQMQMCADQLLRDALLLDSGTTLDARLLSGQGALALGL